MSGLKIFLPVLFVLAAASGDVVFAARRPSGAGRSRADVPFQRGVCLYHIRVSNSGYGTAKSMEQLRALKALGVEWVTIIPGGYQKIHDQSVIMGYPGRPGKTDFFNGADPTMTDEIIEEQIRQVHSLGMKVMIKPIVYLPFTEAQRGHWRGTIRMLTSEAWTRWFENYENFIMHYALIAKRTNAEMFCIGAELVSATSPKNDRSWRHLIHEVRKVYKGGLTYAAHHQGEYNQVRFWNELDCIGIDAYFPLVEAVSTPTQEAVLHDWQSRLTELRALALKHRKSVLFTEAGYRSVDGSLKRPWAWKELAPVPVAQDTVLQERAYKALLETFWMESWWRGVYWWKWPTDPAQEAQDIQGPGFYIEGKPAAEIMKEFYSTRPPTAEPPSARSKKTEPPARAAVQQPVPDEKLSPSSAQPRPLKKSVNPAVSKSKPVKAAKGKSVGKSVKSVKPAKPVKVKAKPVPPKAVPVVKSTQVAGTEIELSTPAATSVSAPPDVSSNPVKSAAPASVAKPSVPVVKPSAPPAAQEEEIPSMDVSAGKKAGGAGDAEDSEDLGDSDGSPEDGLKPIQLQEGTPPPAKQLLKSTSVSAP